MGLLATATGVWVSAHEGVGIVRIDPHSDRVVAHTTVFTKAYSQPGRMVAVGANVLDVNYSGHTVSVVNTATNKLRRTFETPFEDCCWPVYARGSLWLLGFSSPTADNPNRLMQIDPQTGHTLFTAVLPDAQWLVFGAGALWGLELQKNRMFRFDLATKRITATVAVAGQPFAFAFGTVWAVNGSTVVRINPATNKVSATIKLPAYGAELTASRDAIWVDEGPLDTSGTRVWKINPATNTVTGRVTLGEPPTVTDDITASPDGSIWISEFDADRVLRIRPS